MAMEKDDNDILGFRILGKPEVTSGERSVESKSAVKPVSFSFEGSNINALNPPPFVDKASRPEREPLTWSHGREVTVVVMKQEAQLTSVTRRSVKEIYCTTITPMSVTMAYASCTVGQISSISTSVIDRHAKRGGSEVRKFSTRRTHRLSFPKKNRKGKNINLEYSLNLESAPGHKPARTK